MRVLVPLDGSEQSMRSLERAIALLSGSDAEYTLFCVQHEGFAGAPEDIVEMFDEDEDDEIFPTRAAAKRMLKQAASRCAGAPTTTKVAEGKVRDEILKEAAAHDLLVMHGLDRSGLREKFRMSNTEFLARNAKCSVLLVDE